MRALAALLRLEAEKMDRERRALQKLLARAVDTHARLEGLRAEHAREVRLANHAPERRDLLLPYLQAGRRRIAELQQALVRLEEERAAQTERLGERRLELRRLEILAERHARRARAETARREQRALDDLVLARRAARPLD